MSFKYAGAFFKKLLFVFLWLEIYKINLCNFLLNKKSSRNANESKRIDKLKSIQAQSFKLKEIKK